jgi:pimeloyl-ACP methyl ester carboxylesterase
MARLGAGGIDWRYARRGDGPTVLLLHTLRTQAEYFAALVRHLDGYDLVVPDLPGHGESSAPRLGAPYPSGVEGTSYRPRELG